MAEFEPDVIEAICGYMNGTQAESVLLITKVIGGESDATAARMVGFDSESLLILATMADGEIEVRDPWSPPAQTRSDVKDRLFLLLDQALAAWDRK